MHNLSSFCGHDFCPVCRAEVRASQALLRPKKHPKKARNRRRKRHLRNGGRDRNPGGGIKRIKNPWPSSRYRGPRSVGVRR
jgi:hypothetical protein